jgi:hypothetical protein
MPYSDTTIRALQDELLKIAGEMQGYTRIGRKPISIEKMLSNESAVTGLPDDFTQMTGLEKASAAPLMGTAAKAGILLALGGAGAMGMSRVNRDRKMGRMMRRQQNQQGY